MLKKVDTKKLRRYAEERGIKFVVLFGSYATGAPQKESDIDVAVYLKGGRSVFGESLGTYSEMLHQLGELFHLNPDKMDLTDLANANILLRYEITSKGKLLYGNETEYEQYCMFAFRDFIDAKPLFTLEEKLIRKRQDALKDILATK